VIDDVNAEPSDGEPELAEMAPPAEEPPAEEELAPTSAPTRTQAPTRTAAPALAPTRTPRPAIRSLAPSTSRLAYCRVLGQPGGAELHRVCGKPGERAAAARH